MGLAPAPPPPYGLLGPVHRVPPTDDWVLAKQTPAKRPLEMSRPETGSDDEGGSPRPAPGPLADVLFDEPADVWLICSDGVALYIHSRFLLEGSPHWQAALNGPRAHGRPGARPSKLVRNEDSSDVSDATPLRSVRMDFRSDIVRTYLKWRTLGKIGLSEKIVLPEGLPPAFRPVSRRSAMVQRVGIFKDLYRLAEAHLDDTLRAECGHRLVKIWSSSDDWLVSALFDDFVRDRPDCAREVIRALQSRQSSVIRATQVWREQVRTLAQGPPSDPEEVKRALWAGAAMAKLLHRWNV